jgi:phage terminase small subunit
MPKIRPTDRQQRFVQEYLVDLNATQAAIRAGYSQLTARQIGSENLAKPAIAEELARRQAVLAERTGITQETVIDGLAAEATRTGVGSSHAARVSAWSWLGRHLGMFDVDDASKDAGVVRIEVLVPGDAGNAQGTPSLAGPDNGGPPRITAGSSE